MSKADAVAFAWDAATPILGLLGFVAVLLLALSVIGQVRR